MNPYDLIPYPGYTHPQTHPDRLAVVGTLFGMKPAPVNRCRVLELGCGGGSNLIPMAWALPESEFIGIDLATRPIASGRQMAADLALRNVELVQGDLSAAGLSLGTFDYIIAHGLFSWVPAEVRSRVLGLCREALAPHGIAFVSYNAYPGCHLRNLLREMLQFHVRGIEDPEIRVQQSLALVQLVAEAQEPPDEYRLWMRAELDRMRKHHPGHLYHDDLAEVNQPFYFMEFVSLARRQGLTYLGEADFFEMSDHSLAPPVRQALQQLAGQRLGREQYLDFLKCRRFRQTLLCRDTVEVSEAPRPEAVKGFRVASAARAQGSPELRPGVSVVFEGPKGAKAETDFALGKAALVSLGEVGPDGLRFDDLLRQARDRLRPDDLPAETASGLDDSLAAFLLSLYGAGLVEFRTLEVAGVRTLSERPIASPLARWQIRHGDWVTSLFHVAVQVEDQVGRQLLLLLDGTNDRPALAARLLDFLRAENALAKPDTDPATLERTVRDDLERNLLRLARIGLLIG